MVLAKVFECAQIADVKDKDGRGQYSMDDKTTEDQR
jgi:hypothetical protein